MVLDLHGVKHECVEVLVEDFVLINTTPLEIITGNSVFMKKTVLFILEKHKFNYIDGDLWNRGVIIVL